MSASQARLLSITARMSDNENTGQSISYSKQRLSDQTQQINAEYNEALAATKLTVLTGFSGVDAQYTDISYNLMTGIQMAQNTKQYVVTDTLGRAMVSEGIADAYVNAKGDFNKFLATFGYSQADVGVSIAGNGHVTENTMTENEKVAATKVHEAWDKYYSSIGMSLGDRVFTPGDIEHGFGDYFTVGWNDEGNYATYIRHNDKDEPLDKDGNVIDLTQEGAQEKLVYDPINYEGCTQQQRQLYDYAMAVTEAFMSQNYEIPTDKSGYNSENKSTITYYQNLYNRMQSGGFFAYTNDPMKAMDGTGIYKYTKEKDKSDTPEKDNAIFENMIRKGELQLEYYNSTEKKFISTTISDDQSIQEVKDERKIAEAERNYTQALDDLENKDKKLDLELKKLDTEHNALQTEYDAVKNVVDKNVEKSFSIFS